MKLRDIYGMEKIICFSRYRNNNNMENYANKHNESCPSIRERANILKYCDIGDFLRTTIYVPIVEQNVKIRGNYFVCGNDIVCRLYCKSTYIKELFGFDKDCQLYFDSDSLIASPVYFLKHDLPYTIRKLDDNSECCEFKYKIKKDFFGNIMRKIHKLYVGAISYSGIHYHVDPPHIDIELMVSTKIFENTESYNNIVNDHIIDVLRQLSDVELPIDERRYAFIMLGAFSSYINGRIKHDKYINILQEYRKHVYSHENENFFPEYIRNNVNIEEAKHFALSPLCRILDSNKGSSKNIVYQIVMFITNDTQLSDCISEKPNLLVCVDVDYTVSGISIYNNIKKLFTVLANINELRRENISIMLDILYKLRDITMSL